MAAEPRLRVWYARLDRWLDQNDEGLRNPEARRLGHELLLARQRHGDDSSEVTAVLDEYGELAGIGPCPRTGARA
jgi:hypothetical protein